MSYEHELRSPHGLGSTVSAGQFYAALQQAMRVWDGESVGVSREQGSALSDWLLRAHLYGFLLQLGVPPNRIEDVLASESALTEIFSQLGAAGVAFAQAKADLARSITSNLNSLVGAIAKLCGASGVGIALGKILQAAGFIAGSMRDCTMAGGAAYTTDRAFENKLVSVFPYLHDGLDFARDGKATAQGVSIQDAWTGDRDNPRKRRAGAVGDWMLAVARGSMARLGAVERMHEYAFLGCMAESVLVQPTHELRREVGGAVFASLIGMLEARWLLLRTYGLRRNFLDFCPTTGTNRYNPATGERATVGVVRGRAGTVWIASPYCKNLDMTSREAWTADGWMTKSPPSARSLVADLKKLSRAMTTAQASSWRYDSNLAPTTAGTVGGALLTPRQIAKLGVTKGAGTVAALTVTRTAPVVQVARAPFKLKLWHGAVVGVPLALLLAWALSAPTKEK